MRPIGQIAAAKAYPSLPTWLTVAKVCLRMSGVYFVWQRGCLGTGPRFNSDFSRQDVLILALAITHTHSGLTMAQRKRERERTTLANNIRVCTDPGIFFWGST